MPLRFTPVARDAAPIPVAQPFKFGVVRGTGQWLYTLPFSIRRGEQRAGLSRCRDEAVDQRWILLRPVRAERIAAVWHALIDPQCSDRIGHVENAACTMRLGLGDKWPIGQQSIEPSGIHLLGQQRWWTELFVRDAIEVDTVSPGRIGTEYEPALVEGTAGDAERTFGQIR